MTSFSQLLMLFVLLGLSCGLELRKRNAAPQFATSAADGSGNAPRPPGYRNAWDDCGGAGASATERMRHGARPWGGHRLPGPGDLGEGQPGGRHRGRRPREVPVSSSEEHHHDAPREEMSREILIGRPDAA